VRVERRAGEDVGSLQQTQTSVPRRFDYFFCLLDRANSPWFRLAKLVQYTANGSSSSLSSCLTTNRTNTRSNMPPTQSKGTLNDCSQTGLNPLFFTTNVFTVTVRADVAEPVTALGLVFGGEYARGGLEESVGGRNGECVQSGMCSETST
jgi:hypothetical protein